MKTIAGWTLDVANHLGASYADVRLADDRTALSYQERQSGQCFGGRVFGYGVRVIADGAWGFAASKELGRAAVEDTAALAVAIAKASARVNCRKSSWPRKRQLRPNGLLHS